MRLILDRHLPSPGMPELSRRFGWLLGVLGVMFSILVGRLWQLQIMRGERYYERTTSNFVKERWIPSMRGRILDRRGVVLADNRPSFNVYATPRYYVRDSHESLVRLLGLNATDGEALFARVEKVKSRNRFGAVLVLEDIDRDFLALIEQSRSSVPGIEVEDVPHRFYPRGRLAAHLLGFMNQINEDELEDRRSEGYEPGDYVGRYGIEKQWENYLRGKNGVERYVVDARGRRLGEQETAGLLTGPRLVPPVPGHNIVLTIDAALQGAAEKALRNHPAGAIAVVETRSGKILALVSK
ncbi:MAG: penicillin-binding protein 2, partial [Pseudomonadota bacterium]